MQIRVDVTADRASRGPTVTSTCYNRGRHNTPLRPRTLSAQTSGALQTGRRANHFVASTAVSICLASTAKKGAAVF